MIQPNSPLIYVALLLVFSLTGCESSSEPHRVLARNSHFVVVQTSKTDTYEELAKIFKGDASFASVIARYNPAAADAGYAAIPLTPLNPSGVFTTGYQQVPVLCYHQFTDDTQTTNRMVVTEQAFARQMRYLHENGYQAITLDTLYQFIEGQTELPDKAVVITVDDGYRSYLDVAVPILRQYNMPSTIFIYPDFIGGGVALNWQDVELLAKSPLIDVQSHSKSHANLAFNNNIESSQQYQQRLRQEVEVAQQSIEHVTGQRSIHYFAYPYGTTSTELMTLLERNHYRLGFTVERGYNPAFSDPLLINRIMIYGGDSLSEFKTTLNTFVEIDLK